MKIIHINPSYPDPTAVSETQKVFKKGGIVVYPTDTAYALGVNAFDVGAIEKLYTLKERDKAKPTHIVVRDWEMIKSLCYPTKIAKELYTKYMPGPLTIILRKRDVLPDLLTGGLDTVGVRIPNYAFTRLVSLTLDFSYTTPSANRSDEKTPYSIDEVGKVLDIGKIDLIVDADKLEPTAASTVVDLTTTPPRVLREGPVKLECF
jgi:L-threonylcarbamoyladenylate synthase